MEPLFVPLTKSVPRTLNYAHEIKVAVMVSFTLILEAQKFLMRAVFSFFWLLVFIKILSIVRKPLYCAVVYILPFVIINLMSGLPFIAAAIGTAVVFGYILLYFWLLDYFGESLWYWLILVLGFVGPNLIVFVPILFN